MRWISPLVLPCLVAFAACSRAERVPRKAPLAVDSTVASFGPRVEPSASAAPVANVAPSPNDEDDAGPRPTPGGPGSASALPIVDAATLLQKIRDSGQRGVVVNVWASWCDPCREELPLLARVAPQLAARGVPIWLVSVDDPDGFAAARALLDSLHIKLPAFGAAPPLKAFKLGVNPSWPGMIPVSFLFDGRGKLRYFWPGEVYESELVPIVLGFVAGKHIDGTADFSAAPGATRGPGH